MAAKAPDPRHTKSVREGSQLPVIEIDYATASGKASDAEYRIPIISLAETQHHSTWTSVIRKKGASDEYTVQAILNYIQMLGIEKAELKCDQEPALVELRDALVRRARTEAINTEGEPHIVWHSAYSVCVAERKQRITRTRRTSTFI